MALTIIAHIRTKKDKIELVEQALLNLVEPTRNEIGCIQYDLHQDNQDPTHFFFFEIWENRELWQEHMQTAHIKAYKTATEGAITSFDVSELSYIGD